MATEAENFIAQLVSQLSPSIQSMVQGSCNAYLAKSGQTAIGMGSMPPATGGGSFPAGSTGGGCSYPSTGIGGGFPPTLNLPGCKVKCDQCAFPSLDTDLRLFSWPQIDQEMWDTDTKLDVIVSGGPFPLAAGTSIVLQQEADRNLTWIPACIQISTTWSGGPPQPGLVSYQWQVAQKSTGTGAVQFSNIQNGLQYEPNPSQSNQVPFPTYKGCDTQVIGALSALQLVVTLSASATSVLENVTVVAYHKRASDFKNSCCTSCASGGSCGCGG
jgi:hypothetical protein